MIFEKVRRVLADVLGVDEESISPETNLVRDLGADSLDVVEVVMALEDEFEVEFDDEEAENMQTVQDIVKYIEALQ